MLRRTLLVTASIAAMTLGGAYAQEGDAALRVIWGGGDPATSVYSKDYVPRAIEVLTANRISRYTWGGISAGTLANARQVTEHPTNIGLGQWDLLKDLNGKPIVDANGQTVLRPDGTPEIYQFTVLAENIGPECLYIVSKEPSYTTLGHVAGNAFDIVLATGKAGSGSLGTWDVLTSIYPELKGATIESVGGALDIVNAVADDPNVTHGFFVMRPNPADETFKLIEQRKLTLVPVVAEELKGSYTFASQKVAYGNLFFGKDKFFTTACTSVAMITGVPSNVPATNTKAQQLLAAIIDRVPPVSKDLRPNLSTWRDMWDSFKEAGADTVGDLINASTEAFNNAINGN